MVFVVNKNSMASSREIKYLGQRLDNLHEVHFLVVLVVLCNNNILYHLSHQLELSLQHLRKM